MNKNENDRQIFEFVVTEVEAGQRLDVFLCEKTKLTRSQIKKIIDDCNAFVGGKVVKAGEKLKEGKTVTIFLSEKTEACSDPEDIDIDVVYEDEDLIVVNKQQGLVVHPCSSCKSGTLVNALVFRFGKLSGVGGSLRPGIVHRIDKDTSGLLVVAKNDVAHANLAKQIAEKTCTREYLALLSGYLNEKSGRIEARIARDKKDRTKMSVVKAPFGRAAITDYEAVGEYGRYTLTRFKLSTGRTHQIRVHAAYIGHPVACDPVYNKNKNLLNHTGQLLHACRLSFVHPRTGDKMEFFAPLPVYFTEILEKLSRS